MNELTKQQQRSIVALIKKELEATDKEFIYAGDIYPKLEKKLASFTSPPFKTTNSLSKYFRHLEQEGKLHEIPYLYREKPGDSWRFYKISHKPIINTRSISGWIDSLVNELKTNGIIQLSNDILLERRSALKQMEEVPRSKEVNIPDTVMSGGTTYNVWQQKNLEIESTVKDRSLFEKALSIVEREEDFFEKNLGLGDENTAHNKRVLIFRLLQDQNNLKDSTKIKLKGSIIYNTDCVFVVNSVSKFLEAINEIVFELNENNEIFYRGQGKFFWGDSPSLYRSDKGSDAEHILFKEIVLKNPDEFNRYSTTFEKLTKMQHYELPTRLLDITSNPLIGLYFAVSNADHDDTPSEVILYESKPDELKYFDSDHVSVISNLAQRKNKFSNISKFITEIKNGNDKDVISSFNKQTETEYLLHTIKGEKPYFLPLIDPRHICSSVIVKSKLDNERIKKQDGAFIIVGVDQNDTSKPASIDFHVKNKDGKRVRLIINEKDDKGNCVLTKIREDLDKLSYNKGSLFPEIMNSANYIKDKYLK